MTETANPCAAAPRTRQVWHAPALWRSVARAAVQPDLLWSSSTAPVNRRGEREVRRHRKACAERWKRVSGRGRSTWRAGSEPLDGRHGERARRWRDRGRPSGLGLPQPRAIRRRTTGTGGASCLRRVGRILELDDAPYRMLTVRFNLA